MHLHHQKAMLVGLLMLPISVSALFAQSAMRVLVADFAMLREVDPSLTGDIPAGWLEEALLKWKNIEVIPRTQLWKEMMARNIVPPLTQDGLMQIANLLEATHVITGAVTFCKVWSRGRRAQMIVQVEMTDVALSVAVNGAVVEAEASLSEASPLRVQMRALQAAVSRCAQEMENRPRLSGQVLAINSFNEIMLDIGSRNGVRKGMRFIVTRQEFDKELQRYVNRAVGEIRVTETSPTDATAVQSVRYKAVQPLDKITAIFDISTCKRVRIKA